MQETLAGSLQGVHTCHADMDRFLSVLRRVEV
jgi:hypothetical protein